MFVEAVIIIILIFIALQATGSISLNKFVKDNMIKENKVAETRKLSNIELDNVR